MLDSDALYTLKLCGVREVTPHMQYAAHAIQDEITYDATDDGPEVDVIRLINGK